MTDRLKAEIESCRTPVQVRKVLARHNVKVVKDTSPEVGTFSPSLYAFTAAGVVMYRFIVLHSLLLAYIRLSFRDSPL